MLAHSFGPLIAGTWIERRKRFMLDVALEGGGIITAHCPNTGAMTGLSTPGARVLLSVSDNPKRRYAHTLEAVEADGVWVGVNTQNPNRIALALARAGLPPFFPPAENGTTPGTANVRPEVRYGRAERIDLLITDDAGHRTFVEVKNVHLMDHPGEASFPDCITARGAKHLDALSDVVRAGDSALMVFLVQRHDVNRFRLARHIDPAYAAAFDRAAEAGVTFAAVACRVAPQGISTTGTLPILDLEEMAPHRPAA